MLHVAIGSKIVSKRDPKQGRSSMMGEAKLLGASHMSIPAA